MIAARDVARAGSLHWLLVLLLVTGVAPARASPAIRPTPAWVTPLELPSQAETKAIRPGNGLRYVLLDHQVSLAESRPVRFRRIVYDVTGEQGLAEAGRVDMQFQPDYQDVVLHEVSILRGGKSQSRAGAMRFERLRRETDLDSGIVDGEETWHGTLPDVRVGDRVDVSYSVIGANPVFAGKYHDDFSAAYGDALGVRRVRILHPAARPLKHRISHRSYRETRRVADGLAEIAWVARALPAVKVEPDVPAWFDAFGSIELSEARDWSEVAAWARPLFAPRFRDESTVRDLIVQLQLSRDDRAGSVARALAFVQGDIRYTGIEIGVNSHAPKPPEATLEHRYGDCKDKTLLLIALLAEVGVKAEPVLVNTGIRSGVREVLPSATAFDHVIVRVRDVPDWSFVDPTRDREHGNAESRAPLPFEWGLSVAEGVDSLIAIPRATATRPEVAVEQVAAKLSLDDSKQGRAGFGIATVYRRGPASAVRADFADGDTARVGDNYLNYMRDIYTDIEQAAVPRFLDSPQEGFARVEEGYRIAWSEADADESLSLYLFQISDWTKVPKETRRTQPMALAGPSWGRQTIGAHLEDGWVIDAENALIENDHFRFERKVHLVGDTLRIVADWRRKRDFVRPADYTRVRKDLVSVRDLLDYPVRIGGVVAQPQEMRASDVLWPMTAVAFVAGFFAWAWRFRASNAVAGIVFRPRRTAVSLVERGAGMRTSLALIIVVGVFGSWIDWQTDMSAWVPRLRQPQFWSATFRGLVISIVGIWLTRVGFRVLRRRIAFNDLLRVAGWVLIPIAICLVGALIAVGGRTSLINADAPGTNALPMLLTFMCVIVLGLGWVLVGTVRAYAGAANANVGQTIGAMLLGPVVVITLLLIATFSGVALLG